MTPIPMGQILYHVQILRESALEGDSTMRYYCFTDLDGAAIIGVETEPGQVSILDDGSTQVTNVRDLILAASLTGLSIDAVAMGVLDDSEVEVVELEEVVRGTREESGDYLLERPFEPSEVWAAGVTYKSSEMERRRESQTPDVYSMVYAADRPELFFKATAERCVGPFEDVGIRGDSTWNVPEPELAFVLFGGEIVGYTIGNDVSSRSIEGENPLYLPQAKMYSRSCAIGPCFVPADSIADPYDLTIRCRIDRDEAEVFAGETSTSKMARKCEELAGWLMQHNPVPDMTTVLTGTAIVPPPDFTLQENDVVSITIDELGTLENGVVNV